MAGSEESDSGMGSMQDSSKDCTPEKRRNSSATPPAICEDDEVEDETLGERLWGLTEMFPEKVRGVTYTLFSGTKTGVKNLYSFSRKTVWIICSSSVILFAPLLFEVERAQILEAQRSHEKQVLLGPNTAVSGGMPYN